MRTPAASAARTAGAVAESRSPTSTSTARPSAAAWSRPESAAITNAPAGSGPTSAGSGGSPPLTTRARPLPVELPLASPRGECARIAPCAWSRSEICCSTSSCGWRRRTRATTTSPRRSRSCPAGRRRTSPPGRCWLGAEARLVARRTDDAGGRMVAERAERARRRAGRAAGRRRAHGHRGRPRGARRDAHARERSRRSGTLGPGDVDASMVDGAATSCTSPATRSCAIRERRPRCGWRGRGPALRCSRDGRSLDGARHRGARARGDARRVAALAPDVVFANEAEAAAFGEPLGCCVGRQARRPRMHRRAGRRGRRARRASRSSASSTPPARATPSPRASCSSATSAAAQRGQAAAARCVTLVGALP